MASKLKLTDITTSYHSFVKDQVLTETQLNEFLDYFDDQDRLTRISLSGVGIVCGFEPRIESYLDNDSQPQEKLIIKQGCGVTTDGDLIHLRKKGIDDPLKKSIDLVEMPYTNYKIFTDDNAKYAPFFDINAVQLPIWEAITEDEVTNVVTEPPLKTLVGLHDMVALLYLECFPDTNNLCDELSCDSQGEHQVARLRVLLVSESTATIILSGDSIFNKHELMSTYTQMKDLSVKRVLLNQTNAAAANKLAESYALSPAQSQVIVDLKAGMTLMANKLTPYFPGHGIATILTNIDAKLPILPSSNQLYFQYRYDLLKDVVDTYNELKEAFIYIATECCPSITSFPKHLMLGKIVPTDNDILIGRYRHKFYRSPILVDNSNQFAQFKSLLTRMDEQLKTYPVLPETSASGLLRNEIKITPSNFRSILGNKAIPFYYNLALPLLKAWNNDKTSRGKYTQNLSYNTSLLEMSPRIQTPLLYNLEPTNFLRIEGHQGRDYKEVMTKINDIKKQSGLSFDLKALSIDLDQNIVIDTANYECEFEDLSVLLKAWVGEQQCGIAKSTSLISAYSLSKPGYNLQEETYTSPIGVYDKIPVFSESAAILGNDPKAKSFAKSSEQTLANKSLALTSNKASYAGEATVIEHLTTEEDSVGAAFLYAMASQPSGKPNDYVIAANYYADAYIEKYGIVWEPEIKKILVTNSFHLLAYTQALSNSIPTSIAGITDAVIASYATNINNLCTALQKIQVTYTESTTLSSKNRAILGLLINQLTTICCAAKQLQTLLVEIDKRKDAILERLTLKKFIEQHPGLEHLAGVEPGGTFVIVYLRKGLNAAGGVQNTPNGTVIADFSLPYMCCSDCAPINFIMPISPIKLRLQQDTLCLGVDNPILTFEAEPADGVIKSDQVITGMTIEGNKLTINPLAFDKTKLNQVIKFTINDQNTDCQLTVVEPLTVDFEVPAQPAMNTLVNFSATSPTAFPAGTKFAWDFGDGQTSTEQTVPHIYSLPLGATNTAVVKLTVTPPSGTCPTVVTKNIVFDQIKISITPTTFCVNDPIVNYPFIITPVGAKPKIDGSGVDPVNYTFTPSKANIGSNPVTLDGVTALTLTVNPLPTVVANGDFIRTDLQLTAKADNSRSVKWTFRSAAGRVVHPAINDNFNPLIPLVEFTNIKAGEVFTATFEATNNCGKTTQPVNLIFPGTTTQGTPTNPTTPITVGTIDTPTTTIGDSTTPIVSVGTTTPGTSTTVSGATEVTVNQPNIGNISMSEVVSSINTTVASGIETIANSAKTVTNESCAADATRDLELNAQLIKQFMAGKVYPSLAKNQQLLYSEASKLYKNIQLDLSDYLMGNNNVLLASSITAQLDQLYKQIAAIYQKNPTIAGHLLALLKLVVELYLAVIQCQDEKKLASKEIGAVFALIDSLFSPKGTKTLTKFKLPLDQSGKFLSYIKTVITYRVSKSNSWNELTKLSRNL